MGELVKGMVEPLAKRWTAAMSGPLVLFWLAGALLVALRHGGLPDVCRAGTQGPAEPLAGWWGRGRGGLLWPPPRRPR